ncbi:VOC family protein [Streptosporangium lutulentum]
MRPTFQGGRNIAMKLPKAQFDRTVAFYRDVLGMEVTEEGGEGWTARWRSARPSGSDR